MEVDRPDRRPRRLQGKSDPVDAEAAARAALSGKACGQPKTRDDDVEMIRTLQVTRRSAVKARTMTLNQIGDLVGTLPSRCAPNSAGCAAARGSNAALICDPDR